MTNAKVRVQVGKAWIEVDANGVKEAIQALSEYSEVFQELTCGLCQGNNVVPNHRQAKGYDFYEMRCLTCGARLSFGQTKEGGRLFPKRNDKDGNEIGARGWHQWESTQGQPDPF